MKALECSINGLIKVNLFTAIIINHPMFDKVFSKTDEIK